MCLALVIAIDLLVSKHTKLALIQFIILYIAQVSAGYKPLFTAITIFFAVLVCSSISILIRDARERLEKMQREAERSKEIAAELIQQLRRDIADSLHDDLAADLTRMLIISRSIRLPHDDDRDRVLDLQDRTQQALAHLRLLIHNLAVSQGPPKEEPTLQEIIESSASTLAQRKIVLDADLDGIERIPALHRSELVGSWSPSSARTPSTLSSTTPPTILSPSSWSRSRTPSSSASARPGMIRKCPRRCTGDTVYGPSRTGSRMPGAP